MKHILLLSLLSLIFSMGAQAQTIAVVNDTAIDGCEKNGGKMTNFSAGKCDYKRCVYSDNKSDGKFYRVGDNSKTNCTDAELKTELERIGTGLNISINTTGGNQGGTPGSAQGGTPGSAQGGTPGSAQGGTPGGAGRGADGEYCEWVLSGVIPSGHACAKACRKNFWGKEGTDKKKCRECLEKWSVENGGDLVLTDGFWNTVPGGRPNRSAVRVPGVQVRTGEIICYDANGRAVSRNGMTGTGCPTGSSTTNRGNTAPNPNSPSGPGSRVVVSTTTSGPALPKECSSTKKKDIIYCENWMRLNSRYACASSSTTADCIGRDTMNDLESRHSGECTSLEECRDKYKVRNRGGGSDLGNIATALVLGGANVASSLIGANAYVKANKANAEACNLSKQAYLNYTVSQETALVTPDQFAALGCNGYGTNQYAGLGGGGLGGWGGSGFTPGYLGGQIGPYGGYNPYGGGAIGGAIGGGIGGIGGYISGVQGGIGGIGGYISGVQGGINGGIGGYISGVQGGIGGIGGYISGVQGGIGGINGGIGGYISGVQGGIGGIGGYISGVQGGGYISGVQGGINGGIGGYISGVQGGGYISGVQGGINGGIGGYISGIQGGGIGGYISGVQGGNIGGLYVAGGVQGGGYPGYPGGGFPGGWGSGVGGGVQGNYWAASQQTSNYDRMLQGQGISYQMGMGSGQGGGFGGGFGSAGFHPMNAGGNFNASFNAGFF